MTVKRIAFGTLTGLALLITACGPAQESDSAAVEQDATPTGSASETPEAEPAVTDSPAAEQPLIPAAFQGRWGDAEDHMACSSEETGGLTITANELRYGVGTVDISKATRIDTDTLAIERRYSEKGQASSKDVNHQLKLANDGERLSEIFDGMAPFDYIRCK